MKKQRFLPSYLTVLITIFIASLIGCDIVQQKNQNRPSKSTEQKGSSVTLVGQIAPDFSLLDMRGNTVSLSALRGKAIVLSFWASW
jgi:peptide methionine sulfoxide reductase msrA/msrB